MKKYITFLLISLFVLVANAQEYEFGKVSKEELTEKMYDKDSTTNAVVLYEEQKVYYNSEFKLITEVFKRIKIYNKEGYEHGKEIIYTYQKNSKKEKVIKLKANTYNLVGNEIIKTELNKDEIYEEEYSDFYNKTTFALPSIVEGSVIEFKYKIISPFIFNLDKIELQYEIPIKNKVITLHIPQYFNFRKLSTGYLPINLKETTSILNGYKTFKHEYTCTNIPAFEEEPFLSCIDNFISSIVYELVSISYPNGDFKNFATTWKDVLNTIYKNPRFGNELKKKGYFEEEIKVVLKDVSAPKDRVRKILDFVKARMTWDGKKSVYTKQGVKQAFNNKKGNVAEINLILAAIINSQHIEANPVLVSTSDRMISFYPTLDGFNYVITRVRFTDGTIVYLDATDKNSFFNVLPTRVLKGHGRVIDKVRGSEIVNYRPSKPSSKIFHLQYAIENDGNLSGNLRIQHNDYYEYDFRKYLNDQSKENRITKLSEKYELGSIDGYEIDNLKIPGKGVTEKMSFEFENTTELIGDEIFFSPLLFLGKRINSFKSEDRKYPVDFGYGFQKKYFVNIKIPEGFEALELPSSGKFVLPENIGTFSINTSSGNGFIQIVINETINSSIIVPDIYPALKEFYNQIIKKEQEQVVLKKVS